MRLRRRIRGATGDGPDWAAEGLLDPSEEEFFLLTEGGVEPSKPISKA